jgi:hypothetical protein
MQRSAKNRSQTMQARTLYFAAAAAALLVAAPAAAQSSAQPASPGTTAESDSATAKEASRISTQPPIRLQHFRPQDKRGLNVFEAPKQDDTPYTGFQLDWGAAFTQQFQSLEHTNTAVPNVNDAGVNLNQLNTIGSGFNNATANLYLNAQVAPGIRVALSTYLSSRHHPETWVKDGYLLVDASPIDVPVLHTIMDYVTLRLGHFEINYGDAHFRRTDNGNALYNPFVGNYIMDAFTTEIGGEVYVRSGPLMAMGGVTGGEIRGQVLRPADRGQPTTGQGRLRPAAQRRPARPADRLDVSPRRSRSTTRCTPVTGPARATTSCSRTRRRPKPRSSRRPPSTPASAARSRRSRSTRSSSSGLELFGVVEQAEGRAANETVPIAPGTSTRWTASTASCPRRACTSAPGTTRVNGTAGRACGIDVRSTALQFGGGWFVTPSDPAQGRVRDAEVQGLPVADIRNGGKFNGFLVEGVVAF